MLKRIDTRISELRKIRQEIAQLLAGDDSAKETKTVSGNDEPQNSLQRQKKPLRDLRIAAIMDEFTLECFRPECQLTELTPGDWEQEMRTAEPELLFIESAWQGKDKLWQGKVNHCSSELYELTDYCHKKNIPVVFWNKEDPVYTDVFMETARRADLVFTTDLECVEKYKTELGHEQVYHLHFAAQPVTHNPIEKYDRKDRFCFAGAYYHRYQDRCRVFDAFSDYFIQSRGFDIYDRNYKNARPEHKFPDRYDPYILGRLEPSEIDVAYKGYVYGINMNSVTQSQTMFARRVFELMASNTLVVGNYSRGVKNYFGDLTFCTDDEKTLRMAFERYCADCDSADKLRLLALRKVLKEHLCEDRLDYVVQKAFGFSMKRKLPEIVVYARVENQTQAQRVLNGFHRQSYANKKLILIGDAALSDPEITVRPAAEFDAMELNEGDFWACFAPNDWYGENYLLDLALTTRYGAFDVIGKGEYFAVSEGTLPQRTGVGQAYRRDVALTARRAMVSSSLLAGKPGAVLAEDRVWSDGNTMSVDAMNYCAGWVEEHCPAAEDMVLADQGVPLQVIEQTAEQIGPSIPVTEGVVLDAGKIAAMKIGKDVPIKVEQQGHQVVVTSSLPAETHQYIYLNDRLDVAPLMEDGTITVLFSGEGTLHTMGCCFFYDKDDIKLNAVTFAIGRKQVLTPPEGTVYLRAAFRFRESGVETIRKIEFGTSFLSTPRGNCFLSRSNILVLTNHYPATDDLYRNMFVHKRLMAYKDQGQPVDVMRMNPFAADKVREFEGINVMETTGEMLACALSFGRIDTVCVHFLDEEMWTVLKNYLGSVRILIWSHGSDIQPWWRREFIFRTKDALEQGKRQSEKRMVLWHEVFAAAAEQKNRIRLVFVSDYARRIVEEDYQRDIKEFSEIIPNLIDTELFTYQKKKETDRLRIISIRPYASKIYANDIAVNAILCLSKKPWFNQVEFTIIGRGELYEETVKPLRNFKNVHLQETFLRQDEIADYYHKNGIVLIPTRGDTQGVSRDEAMSCGLVPVTNAVAAIPEFVDDSCGIMAGAEDYQAIADGIERLYQNPELFLEMSANAAKRVRSQTSREYTIDKEVQLVLNAI